MIPCYSMLHRSGTFNSTSGNTFPSHEISQQHIISSTNTQYDDKHASSGEMQPQKWVHVSTSTSANTSTAQRSRRSGPLRPAVKTKAAAVRKKRACFRCAALKHGCEDARPCTKCKNILQPSKRAKALSWMKCIVYTVSTYSIYISDPNVSESLMSTYLRTITSMLDQVQMPSNLQTFDLDLLAAKYAGWISHGKSDIPSSKFGILCSSDFQLIASHGLGEGLSDDFIKDFRFLLWATSLYYTAIDQRNQTKDETTYATAFRNLEKMIALCGNRVISHLDELCHPERIKDMPSAQCKLLFLIVIGLCLSVSYVSEKNGRFPASPDVAPTYSYKIAYEQSPTFIAALANIVAYIGYLHGLFPSSVDYSAIVDAAHRRWDKNGSFTWQIPSEISKRLTEELLAHEALDFVPAKVSQRLAQKGQLAPGSNVIQVQCGQEYTKNASSHQQASQNECLDCVQNNGLCAFCEFIENPVAPHIDSSNEAPLPTDETAVELYGDPMSDSGSSAVDMGILETQLTPRRNSYGDSMTYHQIKSSGSGGHWLWFCCQCGDGPHSTAVIAACCACEHIACGACKGEFG